MRPFRKTMWFACWAGVTTGLAGVGCLPGSPPPSSPRPDARVAERPFRLVQCRDYVDDGAALIVEATISTEREGVYSLTGSLLKNGVVVCERPSRDSVRPTGASLSVGPTPVAVTLRFSGEDLRESGLDGPYTVTLVLIAGDGVVVGDAQHTTAVYDCRRFAERPARILSAEAALAPADRATSASVLVRVKLDVSAASRFFVEANLSSRGRVLVSHSSPLEPRVGVQEVELLLLGVPIRASGVDGPYDGSVFLMNDEGTQIDREELTTPPWRADRF